MGLPHFPAAFHVPVVGGWVDSRVPDIARVLHAMSSGVLELVCRVNRRTRQAECYDLFETDRTGQKHWVMRWGLDEVHRILEDVRRADRQAPGHVPVKDLIRAANAAKERDNERERQELGEGLADVERFVQGARDGEHVSWLVTDTLVDGG